MENGSSPPTVAKAWHVLGFVLLVAIGAYATTVSLKLGLWRQNSPGEGLFPFLAAASMTLFGGIGLVGALRAPQRPIVPTADAKEFRATLLRVTIYLIGLVFYASALDAVGFVGSTILVLLLILHFAEGYAWHTALALAGGTVAVCHVVFARWLGAILPMGYLWDGFLN